MAWLPGKRPGACKYLFLSLNRLGLVGSVIAACVGLRIGLGSIGPGSLALAGAAVLCTVDAQVVVGRRYVAVGVYRHMNVLVQQEVVSRSRPDDGEGFHERERGRQRPVEVSLGLGDVMNLVLIASRETGPRNA